MLSSERSKTRLETISIEHIKRSPYQPRKSFSKAALIELAGSIKNYGLLQPISVRFISKDNYELIAGERRYRAVRMLGHTQIEAIVHYGKEDESAAMLTMIENLQRENLHFFEEAEGYVLLLKEHGMTQESLAKKLCKNQSTIANKLRLLKLPFQVKLEVKKSGLTERHARALLRLHDEKLQLKMLETIAKKNCSVRETELLVERELKKLYDEDPEKTGKLKFLFSDLRIYINTVKKAVEQIKTAGINADIEITDNGSEVDINISLKKPANIRQQHTVVV